MSHASVKAEGPALLRAWREQAGMSQVEAAEKVDVRQNTWSDWEHGRKSPQIRQAIAIFRLTGVPVESWAPDTSAKAS